MNKALQTEDHTLALANELNRSTPFESLEEELTISLMLTNKIVIGEMDRFFKRKGISGPQVEALRCINELSDRDINIQMIGARMASKHPDVTRIVDRLERSGLVERDRTGNDRRVVTVRITERGEKLINKLNREVQEIHKKQFSHLSETEMKEFIRMLARLRNR